MYNGLAIASDRLYATDFHNGRIDVFDASFNPVTTAGGFRDTRVAKGFAPFGIQALAGNIFVTYAKQDAAAKRRCAGLRARRSWTSSHPTGSWSPES